MLLRIGKILRTHDRLLLALLQQILEHTGHGSPVVAMQARAAAAQKLKIILDEIGVEVDEDGRANPIRQPETPRGRHGRAGGTSNAASALRPGAALATQAATGT